MGKSTLLRPLTTEVLELEFLEVKFQFARRVRFPLPLCVAAFQRGPFGLIIPGTF